jgi:mannose/cellobiose epimerase-like protein (N-acyl-D-glucosamine 2-epimerase family)
LNFYDKEFLLKHCKDIFSFYDARIVDVTGGYFQNFRDDGSLFDKGFRHLVSSTRMVVNYATAGVTFARQDYLDKARHGLDYIEQVHWQEEKKSYAWTLRDHQPEDMTQQAYGYAFILLAYAAAKKAAIIDSDKPLLDIYELLEQRFWQSEYGLYADEINEVGILQDYRGQNANMHLCEAMIAAYEASGNSKFLAKAQVIAENIVQRQANLTNSLVWEHYTQNFQPDWEYNKRDPKNLYRPWGFQPGHQTEWAKLLLMINRHKPQVWLVTRAKSLFDSAFDTAWDKNFGGLIYGFEPNGEWCDDDKYFWVQAESFAAAAMLYQETDEQKYLQQYQLLWQYSWDNMIDHQYGAWFRVLRRDNSKYSNQKSAAGSKCDYHTLGSCFEVIRMLNT